MYTSTRIYAALSLILFLSFTVSGIAQYPGTPLRSPGTLHPLPLTFTGRQADLILPGDAPKQAFVKTHLLEVASDASTDINAMLIAIRKKGTDEGVDGVILSNYGNRAIGAESAIMVLTGVAIKYISNVNYLDTIIKLRVIQVFRDGGPFTVLMNFDWRGQWLPGPTTDDDAFYADSVMPFDLHNALFGKITLFEPVFGYYNRLSKVKTTKGCTRCLDINLNLPTIAGEPIILRVQRGTETNERFKLHAVYSNGRLTGAIVNNARGKPLFYLHYRYDSMGRVAQERWEKLVNGKAVLWLDIENRFFSNDYAEWPVQ